uniref:Uncharacterized protein n=1 Tax=Arundo donax TaxID=35708 RepID=A0A0A9ABE6_ARUDO
MHACLNWNPMLAFTRLVIIFLVAVDESLG